MLRFSRLGVLDDICHLEIGCGEFRVDAACATGLGARCADILVGRRICLEVSTTHRLRNELIAAVAFVAKTFRRHTVSTQGVLRAVSVVELAALAVVVCWVSLALAAASLVCTQEGFMHRVVVAVVDNGAASLIDMAHRDIMVAKHCCAHPRERSQKADSERKRLHRRKVRKSSSNAQSASGLCQFLIETFGEGP